MSFVNLLPDDYVARQAQKRTNLLCSALFGVVVAGLLTAAVVSERSYRHTREVSARVRQAYEDAGKLITQLQELEARRQRMLDKANRTAALLERVPRSYLLAAVTEALPEGSSLTRFKLEATQQITISGADKTRYEALKAKRRRAVRKSVDLDVQIGVTGLAATDVQVARFIAAMARCPLVALVELVYSQEKKIESRIVREFKVILVLKPDADVREAGGGGASVRQASADVSGKAGEGIQ